MNRRSLLSFLGVLPFVSATSESPLAAPAESEAPNIFADHAIVERRISHGCPMTIFYHPKGSIDETAVIAWSALIAGHAYGQFFFTGDASFQQDMIPVFDQALADTIERLGETGV